LLNRLHADERRDAALRRAQERATSLWERFYVFAVAYSTRRGRAMLWADDSDMTYSEVLRDYLSQLRASPPVQAEVSRIEVEYRLLEALHYDDIAGGDSTQAITTAKEMILLATVAQVPEIVERARRYYRSAIAQAGRYHEDLTERLRTLQKMSPTDAAFVREKKGLAVAQMNVGDLDGALHTAQEEPELPVHRIIVRAFQGQFGSGEEALLEEDKGLGWIGLCLRRLAVIDAVPPWRGSKRRAEAVLALETIRQQKWRTSPTDRPFVTWLEAKGRFETGEYGLARHLLNEVPQLENEDLLSRTLLAGLRLELALTDEAFRLQTVRQSEEELRQIFDHARGLRHGSARGLADVLMRWHPRPAAYLALCPQPVPELLPAAEAVLRCRKHAEAYGLVLPPQTALEEALRACGAAPPQARWPHWRLGSNARFQRQRLAVQRGELTYWRPVVSATFLILGLASVKMEAHQQTAERLIREYGLVPTHVPLPLQADLENLRVELVQRLDTLGFTSSPAASWPS
jgi:hypothetical protein